MSVRLAMIDKIMKRKAVNVEEENSTLKQQQQPQQVHQRKRQNTIQQQEPKKEQQHSEEQRIQEQEHASDERKNLIDAPEKETVKPNIQVPVNNANQEENKSNNSSNNTSELVTSVPAEDAAEHGNNFNADSKLESDLESLKNYNIRNYEEKVMASNTTESVRHELVNSRRLHSDDEFEAATSNAGLINNNNNNSNIHQQHHFHNSNASQSNSYQLNTSGVYDVGMNFKRNNPQSLLRYLLESEIRTAEKSMNYIFSELRGRLDKLCQYLTPEDECDDGLGNADSETELNHELETLKMKKEELLRKMARKQREKEKRTNLPPFSAICQEKKDDDWYLTYVPMKPPEEELTVREFEVFKFALSFFNRELREVCSLNEAKQYVIGLILHPKLSNVKFARLGDKEKRKIIGHVWNFNPSGW